MNMTFRKKIIAGILCFFMFLIISVTVSAADNISWNDAEWSGSLTGLEWTYEPDFHFNLGFSDEKILGVFPTPVLHMSVTLTLGLSGNFDLNLKEANLAADTSIDTPIERNINGLYKKKISDSFYKNIPAFLGFGFDMDGNMVAGASQPVRVKGRFQDVSTVRITTAGFSYTFDPDFEFTSVEPGTQERTVVFIGASVNEKLKVGEVGWKDYKLGPILTGNIGLLAGAKTEALLKKDEWTAESIQAGKPDSIHSCTENGRAGCVDGTVVQVKDVYENLKAHLEIPLLDYTVINQTWSQDHNYDRYNRRHYVQSLTWKEKLKYQDHCGHYVYRIPVAVWVNKNKTIPAKGVYVQKEGYSSVDSNVSQFAFRKTGQDGKTTLYLPYIDGKHTIIAEPYNSDPQYRLTKGSSQQPSDMRRGANEQVDIILQSVESTAYTVRKEWDIDFENKDKPESIEVLLQAQYYNSGYFSWEGVQKVRLSEENNWEHTFEEVPKYEMNAKGEMVPIKYRIRELKENSEGGGGDAQEEGNPAEGLADGEVGNVGVVQGSEGLFHPDSSRFAGDSRRVVPSRWDLDNTYVWATIKNMTTDWNELWQFEPTMEYLKRFAKSAIFPEPSVTYKVNEYTTAVGEHVDEHRTKYMVEYDTSDDGLTTTIKNTAMMDMTMYKRWIMLGDAEEPEYVYLALCYRVDERYRQYIGGGAAEKFVGLWLPVINPLGGHKINIINLVGGLTGGTAGEVLEWISKLDVANMLSVPLAVGKATQREELGNPLTAWRVIFQVKKYGWLGIDGIPVEYQAMELSSGVITDVVKFLTGFDLPVSLSVNLSGDMYVSVAGKLLQIPGLDQDWERTANVINTWLSVDSDAETAIGGTKYWINDKEEDRPESLDIVVWEEKKEGTGENAVTEKTKVGRTTIYKKDNEGKNSWVWALKNSETENGVTLDSSKTYIITEEYPEGYTKKDNYVCEVNGHDLTNTWADEVRVVIRKDYDTRVTNSTNYFPDSLNFRITDENGSPVGDAAGYTMAPAFGHYNYGYVPADKTITLIDGPDPDAGEEDTYVVDGLNGSNISRFSISETITYDQSRPAKERLEFHPEVTGPVLSTEKDSTGRSISTYTFTVTNRVQRPVGIKVRKKWTGDQDDTSGRPEKITVKLKRDGTEIGSVELAGSGSGDEWVSSVIDRDSGDHPLTALDPETGKPYQYTVEEQNIPSGYTSSLKVEEVQGQYGEIRTDYEFIITNKLTGEPDVPEKETVTVKGRKTWDDNDNGNGLRPDSILIRLMTGDGPAIDENGNYIEQTVSGPGWTWEFNDLPRYSSDGEEIRYRVAEGAGSAAPGTDPGFTPVEGYTVSYADPVYDVESRTWTCDVTNSSDRINVSVVKVWEDNNNETEIRPEKVTIHLIAKTEEGSTEKETVQLSEDNNWSHTFRLLPGKEGEQEITYSVEEDPVEGYGSEITSAGGSFTITNTTDGSYINIPVTKVWEGDEAVKSDRPDSVTVRLYRGGEEADSMSVYASNGWKGIFRGVPGKDENGQPISYTLKEDKVSGYEEAGITGSAEEGFTVTNTYNGKLDVTVSKVWETYSGEDVEFDYIPFALKRKVEGSENENVFQQLQNLRKDEGWTRTFEGLPKYDEDGEEYIYSVQEAAFGNGFVTAITETDSSAGPVFIITNKQEKRRIEVTKVWDDDDNAQGTRPELARVYLLQDGERVKNTAISAGTSPNSTVFNDLPVFREDGKTFVQYTVEEDPVQGYAASVRGNMEDGFTITNTLIREKKNITVKKKWEDGGNENDNRPDSVTVRLYADGMETGAAQVKASENWTYTFTDLPVMDNSGSSPRVIEYAVEEDPVPGYDSAVSGTAGDGFTVTNSRQSISITVRKVWEDDEDEEDRQHEPVRVYLYRDKGQNVMHYKEAMLNTENGWQYTWNDLPVYRNGAEIDWWVEESPVEGYTGKITGSAGEGFIITNTPVRVRTTTDVTVTKEWLDGVAPAPEVTVILLSDEETEGVQEEAARYTMTAGDGWTHTFEDMPIFAGEHNRVIVYSVQESPLDGYGEPYYTNGQYNFMIQNWKPDKTSVIVEKIWSGDGESDRPEEITIYLRRNGETCETRTLKKGNSWKTAFENLDRLDEEGQIIRYTVEEEEVEGYEKTIESSVDEARTLYQFTIRNSKKTTAYDVTYIVHGGTPSDFEKPEDLKNVAAGTPMDMPADPVTDDTSRNGVPGTWTFSGWKITSPDGLTASEGSYTMPEDDVVISGSWSFTPEDGEDEYTLVDPVLPAPEEPAVPETVTITWLNYDGTLIEKTTVEYNSMPDHAAPARTPSAEGKTYTFLGWTPQITAATEDTAYTARFLEKDDAGGTESEIPVPPPVTPEDPDETPSNHEDLPEITTKNHYYEVYQIFRGDYAAMPVDPSDESLGTIDVLTNIVWGENGRDPGGSAAVGDPVDQSVLDALAAVVDKELDREKLDVIENYVTIDGNPYRTITLGPGDTENSIQLPPGYYLIRDAETSQTGRFDAYTTYITVVIKDYTIQPKSVIPTVDKQVYDNYDGANREGWAETADHNINESFGFALIGTIPYNSHLVDYTNGYVVRFTDTMSPGVTFESIDKVTVNGTEVPPGNYTVTGVAEGDAGKTWTIELNARTILGEENFGSEGISVIVTYSAHLNENAIVHTASDDGSTQDNTNRNSVFLEYSNNPNTGYGADLGRTLEDSVWVFTYEVDNIKKGDSENGPPLPGARFTLLKEDGTAVKLLRNGQTYIVADQAAEEGVVTEMVTDETGVFNIRGLDVGTYTLRENAAPKGYNTLADRTFSFYAAHEESATEGSAKLNLTGSSMHNTIVNQSGSELPSTGGMGTALYYIIGAILALGAGILYRTYSLTE
ncbi:MAG: Cna B-type domain-containing protein [Eubacteriales bacterium]|nr:Cna B-type domain-containing protein [Eubacteriales bacterium]